MSPSHFSKKKNFLSRFKQACNYLLQTLFSNATFDYLLHSVQDWTDEHLLVLTQTLFNICATHVQFQWFCSLCFDKADQTFRLVHFYICSNDVMAAMRPAELQENWIPQPALVGHFHLPFQSYHNKCLLSSGPDLCVRYLLKLLILTGFRCLDKLTFFFLVNICF